VDGSVDQEEIGGGTMIEKEIDHDKMCEYSWQGLQLNSDGELDHAGTAGDLEGCRVYRVKVGRI